MIYDKLIVIGENDLVESDSIYHEFRKSDYKSIIRKTFANVHKAAIAQSELNLSASKFSQMIKKEEDRIDYYHSCDRLKFLELALKIQIAELMETVNMIEDMPVAESYHSICHPRGRATAKAFL